MMKILFQMMTHNMMNEKLILSPIPEELVNVRFSLAFVLQFTFYYNIFVWTLDLNYLEFRLF